jgi:hypothetical protein
MQDKVHYIISRFVKEDALVEHVIEGLRKADLLINNNFITKKHSCST